MRDNARRLLTILTVILALWLVLGFWPLSIGNQVIFSLCILLAGGAAALARLRDRRPAAGLLAAGIACLVFAAVEYGQFQPFAGLDGQTVTVI